MIGNRNVRGMTMTTAIETKWDMSHVTADQIKAELARRSLGGGAWVAVREIFGPGVSLLCFKSPSRIPDCYCDLGNIDYKGTPIGWKGTIRGMTPAAIIRDQNRGLGCE